MVFWHTAYKKHHTWLIKKTRSFNYFVIILAFYSVYWYNRYSANRVLAYLDRIKPDQAKADAQKRNFGFNDRYVPAIARSRKHLLISRGEGAPRIPFEDQLLPAPDTRE
jgi:hypothetical protein